ncbi:MULTISPECIES: hypothetical protein [Limnospira]|nr:MULTISPECIES: hypothetical protein [unclassified Limnospira]MDT9196301.1 hypothetical protein [Limnospira sp. PMC 1245.20]MDT9180939.1 hypothetical protein [Limnospira sp. PMC 1238.20]MDT9211662.1 hypothetical protein [Limnospira sp. PMC 1252.20]MDT9216743.1 hypothetical protein [Limnospira sp. PMC 1256.20]MDT9262641.1 hypothetical protein [Limnospira sp. PMC 1236.20]
MYEVLLHPDAQKVYINADKAKIPSDFAFVGWVKCNVTQHLT